MAPKKKPDAAPRELTPEDREHIGALHARFGAALSYEQVESNYRMSLAMPDANGRTPSAREQLGAMKLFSDMSIPRPKAEEPAGERATVIVGCPFCGPCSCGR